MAHKHMQISLTLMRNEFKAIKWHYFFTYQTSEMKKVINNAKCSWECRKNGTVNWTQVWIQVTEMWRTLASKIGVYFFYDVKEVCRSAVQGWYGRSIFLRDLVSVCLPASPSPPFLKSHDTIMARQPSIISASQAAGSTKKRRIHLFFPESPHSFPLSSHWPDLSHVTIPHCKGSREI